MINIITDKQRVYEVLDIGLQPIETHDVSLLVFYYKATAIFDEVNMRTSYIAKSRRDKETKQHLLDLVALTKDDQSVFDPFLRDATSKIFEGLSGFTKQVSGSYLHLATSGITTPVVGHTYNKGDRLKSDEDVWELTGVDSEVQGATFVSTNWTLLNSCFYTDDKVEFVLLQRDWFNMNSLQPCDSAIFEAMVSYVMARWFKIVFPEEVAAYYAEFDMNRASISRNLNSQNRPLNRRHRMF